MLYVELTAVDMAAISNTLVSYMTCRKLNLHPCSHFFLFVGQEWLYYIALSLALSTPVINMGDLITAGQS